jgi:hypothetical protein
MPQRIQLIARKMKTAPVSGFCLLCLAAAPTHAKNFILVEDSELLNPAIRDWLLHHLSAAPGHAAA